MKSLICMAALAAAALAAPAAAQAPSTNTKAPIAVEADTLVTSNSGCEYTWTGNAEALQDNARLRADVLKAFSKHTPAKPGSNASTGCGELERLEAHGNVYYVAGDQRMRANDAVYVAGSTTITMTGDVISVKGQNVLRGDKMIYNTDTGQGEVFGAAKGRGAKNRPRGVFYPQSSDKSGSSNPDKPK